MIHYILFGQISAQSYFTGGKIETSRFKLSLLLFIHSVGLLDFI